MNYNNYPASFVDLAKLAIKATFILQPPCWENLSPGVRRSSLVASIQDIVGLPEEDSIYDELVLVVDGLPPDGGVVRTLIKHHCGRWYLRGASLAFDRLDAAGQPASDACQTFGQAAAAMPGRGKCPFSGMTPQGSREWVGRN